MSTITQINAVRKRRTDAFGPNNELLGIINDGEGVASDVGAIMWSMGFHDMQLARRLGKHGIPSLLVTDESGRRIRDLYGKSGVALCTAAMDKLTRDRNVSSFVLMGNCAFANVCLRTAVLDPRAVALVLSNPHVTQLDAAKVRRSLLRHRLLRPGNWKRLVFGRTDVRANLEQLRVILGGKRRRIDRSTAAHASGPSWPDEGDITIPKDLDEHLRKLCDRGVKTLIACARGDVSFHYLRAFHGRALRTLEQTGRLEFVSLDVDVHNMTADEAAAHTLRGHVAPWLETALCAGSSAARQ
jgi:hypothetical protein